MTNSGRKLVFLGILASALCGCAVGGFGDGLGTTASGNSSQVTLSWDQSHGWDRLLSSQETILFAEYRVSDNQLTREALGSGQRTGSRTLTFALPQKGLKSLPAGPVCLYFQPSGAQTPLPLRKVNTAGRDTARFRSADWERNALARSSVDAAERRAQQATHEQEQIVKSIRAISTQLSSRGIANVEECTRYRSTSYASSTRPYDVIPLQQHDEIARKTCVNRIKSVRSEISRIVRKASDPSAEDHRILLPIMASTVYRLPEMSAELMKSNLRSSDFASRSAQAKMFLDDWRRLEPSVGPDYLPHFGGIRDFIRLPSVAADAQMKMAMRDLGMGKENDLTSQDMMSIWGADLDAYAGCVDDGKKQLRTKLDSWLALEASAPERSRERNRLLAQECAADFSRLETLDRELKRRIADSQASRSTSSPASVPSSSEIKSLNFLACEP